MAKPLVDDVLWNEIRPLLPEKRRRFRFPGRKRLDDRAVLSGIIFVLMSGIPWEMLPQEMGCGSGMTCWRRLYYWNKRGIWKKVQKILFNRIDTAEKIDWSRAIIDSSSVRPSVIKGKKWSKSGNSKQPGRHTTYHDQRSKRFLGVYSLRKAS